MLFLGMLLLNDILPVVCVAFFALFFCWLFVVQKEKSRSRIRVSRKSQVVFEKIRNIGRKQASKQTTNITIVERTFVCLRQGTAVLPLLLIAIGSNSPSLHAVLGSSILSMIEHGMTYSMALPTTSSPNSKPLSASQTVMFSGVPARCTPNVMLVHGSLSLKMGFKSLRTLHDFLDNKSPSPVVLRKELR